MYSLLISAILDRRRADESASAIAFPDMHPFYRQLIFDGIEPISMPVLRFRMDRWCARRDYLEISNVALAWLCSQRFHEVLTREAIPCRTYPVEAYDAKTGHPLAQRYYLFIPDTIKDAIDLERSEFYTYPHGLGRELTNLVLKPTIDVREHPLFQAGPSTDLLVHDRVRARLEVEHIVGIAFAPLNTVFVPWHGVEIVEVQQHVRQQPKDTAKWLELARLWSLVHCPQEALEALDHALDLAPEMAELWRQRGMMLAERGQDEAALAAFEQAMALNAQSPPGPERPLGPQDWAWLGRCALLRKHGRYPEALSLAESGVHWFPNAVDGWYELGMVQLGLGNLEGALEAFTQAPVRGAPQNELIFEQQGEILCRLGRYEEALALYDRALPFTPSNLTLRRGRLKTLRALEHQAEAEQAEAELRQQEEVQERVQKAHPW